MPSGIRSVCGSKATFIRSVTKRSHHAEIFGRTLLSVLPEADYSSFSMPFVYEFNIG